MLAFHQKPHLGYEVQSFLKASANPTVICINIWLILTATLADLTSQKNRDLQDVNKRRGNDGGPNNVV